MPGGVG